MKENMVTGGKENAGRRTRHNQSTLLEQNTKTIQAYPEHPLPHAQPCDWRPLTLFLPR